MEPVSREVSTVCFNNMLLVILSYYTILVSIRYEERRKMEFHVNDPLLFLLAQSVYFLVKACRRLSVAGSVIRKI